MCCLNQVAVFDYLCFKPFLVSAKFETKKKKKNRQCWNMKKEFPN